MKFFLIVAFSVLVMFVLSSCITEHSLAESKQYSRMIGQRIILDEDSFLMQDYEGYYLKRECELVAGQDPTFEEFRSGKWENNSFRGAKFIDILPAGTALIITDVRERFHIEVGTTIKYKAKIADNNFSHYGDITLPRYLVKILTSKKDVER